MGLTGVTIDGMPIEYVILVLCCGWLVLLWAVLDLEKKVRKLESKMTPETQKVATPLNKILEKNYPMPIKIKAIKLKAVRLYENGGSDSFKGEVSDSPLGKFFVQVREFYGDEDGYHEVHIPVTSIMGKKEAKPKINFKALGKKPHRIMLLTAYSDYYSELEGIISPSKKPGYFHFDGEDTVGGEGRVKKEFEIKAIAYLEHYDWLHGYRGG